MNVLTAKTGIIIGAGLLLAGLFWFASDTPRYDAGNVLNNRAYWSRQIAANSAEAYAMFKEKNAEAPIGLQHSATHLFGELLFTHEGVAGISVCDATFAFGCYHGFFTRAIAEEGIALVPELDSACLEAYGPLGTGCQHGIGHGIMEYFGYADINTALAVCEKTTQVLPLAGCSSGVFMEYHIPAVASGEGFTIEPKPVDPANPYLPCGTVSDQYRDSCYFELGSWWRAALGSTHEQMGAWCSALPSRDRKRCFLGLGAAVVPTEDFEVDRILERCRVAATGENYTLCIAGASWSFNADPAFRHLAPALCDTLDASERALCKTNADITNGQGGISL